MSAVNRDPQAVWDKIKERELKRWLNALDEAVPLVVNNNFAGKVFKGEELAEVMKFQGLVRATRGVLAFYSERALLSLPSPTGKVAWGPSWEVYLSGLRHFLSKIGTSYLVRAVAPAFKAEDVANHIVSFLNESARLMPFLYSFSRTIRAYVTNLSRGYELWQSYAETEPDERLIAAYASWKTWETDAEYNAFFSSLHPNITDGIEIYVEGPMQLYLILSAQYFMLIYRIFTVEKLSELFGANDKELQSVQALHEFLNGCIKRSEVWPIMVSLLKHALKIYLDDVSREHSEKRRFVTQDTRTRFIEDFEQGRLARMAQKHTPTS